MIEQSRRDEVESWLHQLQDSICAEFESIETNGSFAENLWPRPGGGGGRMRIMRGEIFEKAGVNCSTVFGPVTKQMRDLIPQFNKSQHFWASGISLVTHMASPFVPTVHMNTRILCADDTYWFGGGADLTPTFATEKDTVDFHDALRRACDNYSAGSYAKYKAECDSYFFIKHRNEPRGVGGIFYDYLRGESFDKDFAFMQDVGRNFLQTYPTIVRRNLYKTWSAEDKLQQLIKRAKYVEFNLVYDRGTKFGLITEANPDAVLMSLPPGAAWP